MSAHPQPSTPLSILQATPRRRKQPYHSRTATPTPSSPAAGAVQPAAPSWIRLGCIVPDTTLIDVTKHVFGYAPRDWQMRAAVKILEGHDTIVIAGTGAGKSLLFALLAMAAELSGRNATVIVICPLKALQLDQVRRLNGDEGAGTVDHSSSLVGPRRMSLRAIAINEDNRDDHDRHFDDLEKGRVRLCYASPECLLRNNRFKQLYRNASFRERILANIVDEAHVIKIWETAFRKDYGELNTLRIVSGTDIPWAAVSATMPSDTLRTVYNSLALGRARPFWGLDLGADRSNLAYWVRPMEYASASFASLFTFIPEPGQDQRAEDMQPEDLPKMIFYFSKRSHTRRACDLLRALLPPHLRKYLYAFHSTYTDEYKTQIMEWYRSGRIRWLFCTDAAGMGCDIPDISISVIYGMQDLSSALQKGGRAGRRADIDAKMIWLVEDWVFEELRVGVSEKAMREKEAGEPKTKGKKILRERREALDGAAREVINRSQSNRCLREFIKSYLRPQLPRVDERGDIDDFEGRPLAFEVNEISVGPKAGACCCAESCWHTVEEEVQEAPLPAPALMAPFLTASDRSRIDSHIASLKAQRQPVLPPPATPSTGHRSHHGSAMAPPPSPTAIRSIPCPREERDTLFAALVQWRDNYWSNIRDENPFLSREWVMDEGNICRLVDKAHLILGAPSLNEAFLRSLITWFSLDAAVSTSLLASLEDFRAAFLTRNPQGRKRRNIGRPRTGRAYSPTPSRQMMDRDADDTMDDSEVVDYGFRGMLSFTDEDAKIAWMRVPGSLDVDPGGSNSFFSV